MVQVELSRIIIDERNPEQAIVLREKTTQRQIPIVVGIAEASSIQMWIAGVKAPRPLTHDLLVAFMQTLGVGIERLVICDVIEGTFFARLLVRKPDQELVWMDCRPSDGVAIAVRMNVPIFMEEVVFQKTLTAE